MKPEDLARLIWPVDHTEMECGECGRKGVLAAVSLSGVGKFAARVDYLCASCYINFAWSAIVVGIEQMARSGHILVTDDPLLAYVIQNLDQSPGFRGE